MLRSLVRLFLLGAAVMFTAATSMIYDDVSPVFPLPGETAVPLDTAPTLRFSRRPADLGPVELLRLPDRSPVPARARLGEDASGYHILRLAPDAPLEPDTDYLFVVGGLADYYYQDDVTFQSRTLDEQPLEIPFSTASDPRARHAERFSGARDLHISFSQELDPATLTTDTVELYLDGERAADPLLTWEGGPGHHLRVTAPHADFERADVVLLEAVRAADGTPAGPQSIEIQTPPAP